MEGVEGEVVAGMCGGGCRLMVMVMLDSGDIMMVVVVVVVVVIADGNRSGEWRRWLVSAVAVDGLRWSRDYIAGNGVDG